MLIETFKTYKFRLYRCDKRDKYLHRQIDVAGLIWNHALALQRRYFRTFASYISIGKLKHHIAKLRMKSKKYEFWRILGSQAIQQVIERLDEAFKRFFTKKGGYPSFKKIRKYRSFTLKQSGWKLLGKGRIRLGNYNFKFVQHRSINGAIKTVTIKRDSARRLWICFDVKETLEIADLASTSKIGGFDFGLKTFVTDHTGHKWMSPEFFKENLDRLTQIHRAISRKATESQNKKKAKWYSSRTTIRIADKRRNFHFQLAHKLCDNFDLLVFEDLNLAGMKRIWGRKISDLGFAQFLEIIQWVALVRGKSIYFVNRFLPTSQVCSNCGNQQKLNLKDRVFNCVACGHSLDRDHNAAINIQRAGASAHTTRDDFVLNVLQNQQRR